ncbi:hypothetical protein HYW46_00275 [Candidatus Daviesbacteria bacterium]|nr:hypothetical protein [Candidatus Daviesbacteria bacterium]
MERDKRRTIGVDKDDVLVDLNTSLQRFHNEQYGTSFVLDDVYSFNLWEIWQCSYEEAVGRVIAYYKSGEMKRVLPMEGAVEAMEILKQKFDLVIITSRPKEFTAETLYTTEKYFPDCFSAIYHTNLLVADWKTKRKKSEICLEQGVDTLIDDSLDNVRDCALVGIKTLLYRRPWNLSAPDELLMQEGIMPVKSWQEIVDCLLSKGFFVN